MRMKVKREKKRKRKKRKWAESDEPLAKQVPENCIVCDSTDTLLIFNQYGKHLSTYGDDAGWSYEDRTREYKCNNCGIYFEIKCSDIHREYYTR